MSICEIFPEDASCAVAEAPVEEAPVAADTEEVVVEEAAEDAGMEGEEGAEEDAEPMEKMDSHCQAKTAVGDWNKVIDMSTFADLSPAMANLGRAGAAAMFAGHSALKAFRYNSASTFYDSFKIGDDTNWYKLADQVGNYSAIAIGGILTLTSLMAAAGIAVGVNGLAWMYLMIGEIIISGVVALLFFLARDGGYGYLTSTDAVKQKAGKFTADSAEYKALQFTLQSTFFTIGAWSNFESAFYGSWNAKTDAEQATNIEMWEESIATKAMAVEEARAAMAPAATEEGDAEEGDAEEGEEGDAEEGDAEEGDAAEGDAEEATEDATE